MSRCLLHAHARDSRLPDSSRWTCVDRIGERERDGSNSDRRRWKLPRLRGSGCRPHHGPRIVLNAKTSRPGVCNAAESLIVHRDVADDFLPMISQAMPEVELVGDERTRAVIDAGIADENDYATEFLSLKMSVAVVDGMQSAIDHIRRFGSGTQRRSSRATWALRRLSSRRSTPLRSS